MRELLRQPRLAHRSTGDQVFLLTATSEGWLDDVEIAQLSTTVEKLLLRARTDASTTMSAIDAGELPEGWKEKFAALVNSDRSESQR